MKTRDGFVSNSSSASFVITWGPKPEYEELTLKDHIEKMFWQEDIQDDIIQNTKILADNLFETRFSTGMFNDITDFGPTAAYMLMALYMNQDREEVNDVWHFTTKIVR